MVAAPRKPFFGGTLAETEAIGVFLGAGNIARAFVPLLRMSRGAVPLRQTQRV